MITVQVLCHAVDLKHGLVTSWENVLYTLENIGTSLVLKLLESGVSNLSHCRTKVQQTGQTVRQAIFKYDPYF